MVEHGRKSDKAQSMHPFFSPDDRKIWGQQLSQWHDTLPDQEPVMRWMLLPGMDATGRLFEPLLRELPTSVRCQVVSYPTQEPLGYDQLLTLVRRHCPTDEDFIIVAESFSGVLAVRLAAEHPAGLRGVVLIGSFMTWPGIRLMQPVAARCRAWWLRSMPRWTFESKLIGRRPAPEARALLREALAMVSPAVMATRARAIATVDATDQLRQCAVPVLYLCADEDRVVSEDSARLIQRIKPDTAVVRVHGPHLLCATAPAEVAPMLQQFSSRMSRLNP